MADQKGPQEASLFPVKASPASVTTPQNGRIGSYFRNISGVAQAEGTRRRGLSPAALRRDPSLRPPFQARQVEHGVGEDALHERTQAASAGFSIDGLAGDRAQR